MPTITPLAERVARYERILAMRGPDPEHPSMALDDIGKAFDPPLTRQRVQQILDRPPRRHGRPRSAARAAALRHRLRSWESVRASRAAKGLPTAYADARVAALSAELAEFDGQG